MGDTTAPPVTIDVRNVQGDILFDGLPKRVETFYFFRIVDSCVKDFAKSLGEVAKHIANAEHTISSREDIKLHQAQGGVGLVSMAHANIAFSANGLEKLRGVLAGDLGKSGDQEFDAGMKAHAVGDQVASPEALILGDPRKPGSQTEPDWEAPFSDPETLHGVLLIAGNDNAEVKSKLNSITKIWKLGTKAALINILAAIDGAVRPDEFKGHEHFGFNDGISQPALAGIDTTTIPGSDFIDPGVILINRGKNSGRPEWMTDGSFLAFRKLQQNVQDFQHFLVDAGFRLNMPAEQVGARFIGRWPSGCPVMLSPKADNLPIVQDSQQVNDFEFDPSTDETKCPVAAHIRKTYPRNDLGDKPPPAPEGEEVANDFRILRRGIPYGKEVRDDPNGKRGLLFVCYQSELNKGFAFIQNTWVNNPNFIKSNAGLDPVLGQHSSRGIVGITGVDPDHSGESLPMSSINRFVRPKGGEYFFSPSLAALKGILSHVKADAPKKDL